MEAQEALDLLTLAQVETNIDNISAAIAFGLNPRPQEISCDTTSFRRKNSKRYASSVSFSSL